MFATTRRSVLFLAAFAALLALHLFGGGAVAAQTRECSTANGEVRDCTASEELIQCWENGADAFHQCREDVTGFWSWLGCWAGWEIDFYACAAGVPLAELIS